MTAQEIPATQQLMDLTVEPNVPRDVQFVFQGLIWLDPDALKSHLAPAAVSNAGLVNETVGYIHRVLKTSLIAPEIAPDLRERLVAAYGVSNGQDAFLTRYVLNQKKVQVVVVTKFHVHIVIAPVSSSPRATLHEYLKVDRPDDPRPWTGDPWKISQVDGFDFGYMPRATVFDWRESIYYLAKGGAVKFSLKKLGEQPVGSLPPKSIHAPTEDSERHWFPGTP